LQDSKVSCIFASEIIKQRNMIMTATLIIIGIIYMIPGFVFGIFAWDTPVRSSLDYVKRVAMHIVACIFWLPFVLWCISPWEQNRTWKEYFKNYQGSDKHLRRILGSDYEKLMKKYGKYIPATK
jgi:hypothetical protein